MSNPASTNNRSGLQVEPRTVVTKRQRLLVAARRHGARRANLSLPVLSLSLPAISPAQPPNKTFLVYFLQPSFWELYQWHVLLGAGGLLLLFGVIYLWISPKRTEVGRKIRPTEGIADTMHVAQVVKSATDGIITFNDSYEVTLFNLAAEKMFDYTAPDAIGQQIDKFIPELRELVECWKAENFEGKPPSGPMELRGVRYSSEEFSVEATASQTGIEGEKVYTLILRDTTERKRVEKKLAESESNYRAIFNAANDALFIHDARSGRILDANARASEMYGWSVDEVRSLGVADLSSNQPPFTQDAAVLRVQEAAFGLPQLFEWRARKKSGRLFWVEVNLKSAILRGEQVVLAVVRDITSRKEALDEMREVEERFGKAFKASPQPMSLTTLAEGTYLDVNDSFLKMSGFTRGEVIGQTAMQLGNWEDVSERTRFVERLQTYGSIVNYETRFRTKDGSRRVSLLSAELLHIQGKECMLVASTDITELVHSQQALRESEQRFRNMADTAPVLIWVCDESKACTYVNKQWLDFTGRSFEDELGQGWTQGIHPDDQDNALALWNSSSDSRRPFQLEYRLRRRDGEYRWVLDCGTPRLSTEGEFLGFIGSAVDITDRKESEVALHKAHEELNQLKNKLEAENIYLHQELQLDQTFGDIVGRSEAIKNVLFKVKQVGPTDSTVLITGETGTGKELVARAIHATSSRKDQSLIKVNCAALSPTLIESELFGHEKGSFTGATARKLGRFELANGSTIFLDEIGELPTDLQVKLLRVIQEGEFERVGGAKTIKVDVRIVAATNRNLKSAVEEGLFREDLWYRLNVFPITVPPLRQRKEDIPLLVEVFVNKYAKKFGKTIVSVPPRTMQSLQAHSWPGNIRELVNVIERAVIHTTGTVLHGVERLEPSREETAALRTLEETERDYIVRVLESTGWRIEGKFGASRILGLNPSTLRTRMTKLGIQRRSSHLEPDLSAGARAATSHED
ncbi:MAG TPA: PAS domain S-box protein [Pyrinomonadaceae bacterium]|nr:PAS domain S-box protein [Pyrinomonadaceae bacterium]